MDTFAGGVLLGALVVWLLSNSKLREIVLTRVDLGYDARLLDWECISAGTSKEAALGRLILENPKKFRYLQILYAQRYGAALYRTEETADAESRVRIAEAARLDRLRKTPEA